MRRTAWRQGSISLLLLSCLAAATVVGCNRATGVTAPSEPFDCSQTAYIGINGTDPSWSPDGRQVAYLAGFDAQARFSSGLYVCDVASGESHLVVPYSVTGPSARCDWNPKPGSNEVLLSYGLGAGVVNMETGDIERIASDNGRIAGARWMPEGDSVAYFSRAVDGEEISPFALAIQHLDGSGRHFFFREGRRPIQSEDIVFSPDGKWLAWTEYIPSPTYTRHEIAVCRRDGTGYRLLTSLGGQAKKPVWINGGTGLLFPWIPDECAAIGGNGPHTTMYVDLSSGNVRKWQAELTDYRFQFSKDIHVDRSGTRALIPGLDPLFNVPFGALYLTSANYTGVRRKLALSSPPPPPPPPPPPSSHP